MITLTPEPLTQAAFAPFGHVIETGVGDAFPINQGFTMRHHALAEADPGPGGQAILSIFASRRWPDPIHIEMLERHPLATQAFVPMSCHDWLVVVAERPDASALRLFRASGTQGVQYARGVWHHPLLILEDEQAFLVVDRKGPGDNLEECTLATPGKLAL